MFFLSEKKEKPNKSNYCKPLYYMVLIMRISCNNEPNLVGFSSETFRNGVAFKQA